MNDSIILLLQCIGEASLYTTLALGAVLLLWYPFDDDDNMRHG